MTTHAEAVTAAQALIDWLLDQDCRFVGRFEHGHVLDMLGSVETAADMAADESDLVSYPSPI